MKSRALCGTCSNKLGSAGEPLRRYKSEFCCLDGCARPRQRGPWCVAHGERVKRHGDPLAHVPVREITGVILKPGRNGTQYRYLRKPDHPLAHADGYVAEHRMVAWDAGILTDPTMDVHHVNHDGLDNRLENLNPVEPRRHRQAHAMEDGTTNQYGHFPAVQGRICDVDGCQLPVRCRHWCTAHYTRWTRRGDPLAVTKVLPATIMPYRLI